MARRVWGGRRSQQHNSGLFSSCAAAGTWSEAVGSAADYSARIALQVGYDFIKTDPHGARRRAAAPTQPAVIASGPANIVSFIAQLRVAQAQPQEAHLLIFPNSLVVFHNHINAGGRVQRCALQIKLQHLRQDRASHLRAVVGGWGQLSEQSFSAIKVKTARSSICPTVRRLVTSFQTGFTSLSTTFVFFFSSESEISLILW